MHVFRFSAQARPPSQSDETRSFHRNPIPILVNLIRQPHPVIPASQHSRQPSQSDSDSWSLLNKRPLRCLFRLLRCFVLRERAFHTCRAIPLSTRPLFSRELLAPRHSSRLRYRRQDRRRRDRSRHWYLRRRCRWRRHGWSSRISHSNVYNEADSSIICTSRKNATALPHEITGVPVSYTPPTDHQVARRLYSPDFLTRFPRLRVRMDQPSSDTPILFSHMGSVDPHGDNKTWCRFLSRCPT